MPYITIHQTPKFRQVSFEDIIFGPVDMEAFKPIGNSYGTRTTYTKFVKEEFLNGFNIGHMISLLIRFNEQYKDLFEQDRQSLYETFHIPKSSGGLRRIDAPKPELMNALRELKRILEDECFALYHTNAFAYIKHRSTIHAIKRHQKNQSNWFLKVDFSNFFGSTTPEFLMKMVGSIFPFSEIVLRPSGREALERALSLCFLNGGLPQGTPTSPMLTNLMMIPIDHYLTKTLRDFNGNSFIYTRYADDILISCRKNFMFTEVTAMIEEVLQKFEAPFTFKREKTRYGSKNGSNWNLGVMLNKDNEITVGRKKKNRMKLTLSNYIKDKQKGVAWDIHDVQVMNGLLSYYRMVEKDYVDGLIKFMNEKFGCDLMAFIKEDLNPSAA